MFPHGHYVNFLQEIHYRYIQYIRNSNILKHPALPHASKNEYTDKILRKIPYVMSLNPS
jgi:hypothetical protein